LYTLGRRLQGFGASRLVKSLYTVFNRFCFSLLPRLRLCMFFSSQNFMVEALCAYCLLGFRQGSYWDVDSRPTW
jgi:hypothetical protein